MIALGYGVTYIWGTVGIILVCKYLPRWWGVDASKAAKEYEAAHGVKNVDDAGITGYRIGGLRAYRLENATTAGQSIGQLRKTYPQYRIANVMRDGASVGAGADLVLQKGDVVALGGRLEELTANMRWLIGFPSVNNINWAPSRRANFIAGIKSLSPVTRTMIWEIFLSVSDAMSSPMRMGVARSKKGGQPRRLRSFWMRS